MIVCVFTFFFFLGGGGGCGGLGFRAVLGGGGASLSPKP